MGSTERVMLVAHNDRASDSLIGKIDRALRGSFGCCLGWVPTRLVFGRVCCGDALVTVYPSRSVGRELPKAEACGFPARSC